MALRTLILFPFPLSTEQSIDYYSREIFKEVSLESLCPNLSSVPPIKARKTNIYSLKRGINVNARTRGPFTDPILNFYHHSKACKMPEEDYPKAFPEENKPAFFNVFNTLPDNEAVALIRYYGLDGQQPRTLGNVFPELSLERNRQILGKALKKMRVPFRAKKLEMLLRPWVFYMRQKNECMPHYQQLTAELNETSEVQEFFACIEKACGLLDLIMESPLAEERRRQIDMLEYCEEAMSEIDDKEKNTANMDILKSLKSQLEVILANAKQNGLSPIRANPYPNCSILELNLPTIVRNSLHRRGIDTIYDLADMTKSDLLSIRGIGAGGAEIIIKTCHKFGINIPEI